MKKTLNETKQIELAKNILESNGYIVKKSKLKESLDNLDEVDTQAVVPPTYEVAKKEGKANKERVEKVFKDLRKEVGISEEDFNNGFKGAGPNNEKAKSTKETKAMHLSEDLFESVETVSVLDTKECP